MKGLELSELFYREYGAPMLHDQFPHVEGLIAVGLVGSGSECFGYDDAISRDHDFEPGFCLFLPDEDVIDRRTAFALERAYAKLPKEFMGYARSPLSPVGGNRHGVIRIRDFLRAKTGSDTGALSLRDWFWVDEQALAELTNGKLFRDDTGILRDIRARFSHYPEDVRRKKLAGHLLLMGQSGQYNYGRCVERGECAAAQLAMGEFVRSAMQVIFLLNRRYMPYYKWSFRALRELARLSSLHESLAYLISVGNGDAEYIRKQALIEEIGTAVIAELREQGLSIFDGAPMEGHAYSVNDTIVEESLRNLHILYAV